MIGKTCTLVFVIGLWPATFAAAQTVPIPSYPPVYSQSYVPPPTPLSMAQVQTGPLLPPNRNWDSAQYPLSDIIDDGTAGMYLRYSGSPQTMPSQQFGSTFDPDYVRPASHAEQPYWETGQFLGDSLACPQCQRIECTGCSDLSREDALIWRPQRQCYLDGLGQERIMFAPFMIETTQPMNNLRLRLDLGGGLDYPDRSEFFWAKSKAPEQSVSHQDFVLMFERGGDRYSTQLHLPLRFLNPELNDNTSGFGDLVIANKLVLFDGNDFQFTGMLRTQLPTGSKTRGLGTGHVALEPGLLGRYRVSPWSYLHGEVRYVIPLGGDPDHSGQVLRYGAGISYLWADSPTYAVMPTLEFIGHSFLSGQKSLPGSETTIAANGDNLYMLYPGIRFAKDTNGDLGIIEYGMSLGLPFQPKQFYDSVVRFDFRVNF